METLTTQQMHDEVMDTPQMDDYGNFLSFEMTWIVRQYFQREEDIVALFTGNQAMKTSSTAYQYVLRILGLHPVARKNVLYFECRNHHAFGPKDLPKSGLCDECGAELKEHQRGTRKFRFASATLPGDSDTAKGGESTDIKNTQYPEFKKWLPPYLIKKDITFRNPAMTIACPFGGPDIMVEFVSFAQRVQQGAGVQRLSIWCDEEPPKAFWDEQIPRLLKEKGDLVLTLTPANHMTWTYDEVYERARVYFRSKHILDYYRQEDENQEVQAVEFTESPLSIAVIQAATDDNPTLAPDIINKMFDNYDDPDVVAIRRYGIFKQVKGRIFKVMDKRVHVISSEAYQGKIPHNWTHGRFVDYHEHVAWAIIWAAISSQNEAFVYREYNPSPEKYTTLQINTKMAHMSGDFKFRLNLIDPHACKTQSNTGTSVLDDFNTNFYKLRHKENIGTGGYWQAWDTKSTRGRDAIRERLMNSVRVKQPFNNLIMVNGQARYLPTLWVLSNCPEMAQSMRQWRLEEWANTNATTSKEMKEVPQQKYSHFPTALEAAFKDKRFCAPIPVGFKHQPAPPQYFKRRA